VGEGREGPPVPRRPGSEPMGCGGAQSPPSFWPDRCAGPVLLFERYADSHGLQEDAALQALRTAPTPPRTYNPRRRHDAIFRI